MSCDVKVYPLDILMAEYGFAWRYDPLDDAYHIKSNKPLSNEARAEITEIFRPTRNTQAAWLGWTRKVIFED